SFLMKAFMRRMRCPLTQHDRFYIKKRKDEGINPSSIVRELGVSRSTVSWELRRNADSTFNGLYSSRRAETLARKRRGKTSAHNASVRLSTEVQNFVRQELALHTFRLGLSAEDCRSFLILLSAKIPSTAISAGTDWRVVSFIFSCLTGKTLSV
ncbi:helix-turn-helix domain-containing protein, partial [Candidatus Erwinia dacicola]